MRFCCEKDISQKESQESRVFNIEKTQISKPKINWSASTATSIYKPHRIVVTTFMNEICVFD